MICNVSTALALPWGLLSIFRAAVQLSNKLRPGRHERSLLGLPFSGSNFLTREASLGVTLWPPTPPGDGVCVSQVPLPLHTSLGVHPGADSTELLCSPALPGTE